ADDARGEAIARAVRLDPAAPTAPALDLNATLALRAPPALAVTTPLPCDLAHTVALEFEGIPGQFAAGAVVLSGQGLARGGPESVLHFPLGPIDPLPPEAIDRPGSRRLRAIVTADPD